MGIKSLFVVLFSTLLNVSLSQTIVTDYPSLPNLWKAETIEPGAPGGGKGVESYLFNDKPSSDSPSAMWSNYTDCQRLIYVPSTNNAKRYLLGCDAVNCCWEPQSGNQVEFQIPNVYYSNPSKTVDVYHQKANVTNFGEIVYADEWSWSWKVKDVLSQDWRAYTVDCDDCVGGVQLIQWQSRAMESEWFPVEFNNYKGYDASSDEGIEFAKSFEVPDICQKNNLLECPSGMHDKYFGKSSKGVVDLQGESECAVASYLKKAGFPSSSIGTMICIAKYESSFNCKATNKNVDGSTDYGLFEINSYYWCSGDASSKYNECGTSCQSLMDCQKNANCAYRVYKEQGYNAWYGYQYHKSECDSYPTPICLESEDNEDIYEPVKNNEKCCEKCEDGKEKYYSVPILSNDHCGESCIKPEEDWKFHLLEPALKTADSNTPCLDRGFAYIDTQTHSAGPIKIDVDIYVKPKKVDNLKGPDCGTCGTGYQTCCIGFAIDGYPCDCHLTEGGSGTAGSNCGDCGTAYAACCIGYATDGYPCQCDVL